MELNINIKDRVKEQPDYGLLTKLIDTLFEPSEDYFCSNRTIKDILTKYGYSVIKGEVSKYMASISSPKVIKKGNVCVRGWMVRYIRPV